jgi:hypothetical protein
MNLLGDSLLANIFIWVGVVFAAGFIGYFGRYLSILLIERIRRKRQHSAPTMEQSQELPVGQEPFLVQSQLELERKQAKLEKKQAKLELKKAKKVGKE